jgi:nitrogen regulatory protein P-II 1
MKKIEAVIRKERLERVKMLLAGLGYYRMTIAEVSGLGRQEGISLKLSSKGYKLGFLPKLKIELVVNDEDVSQVLGAIVKGAKTGEIGDGKIFVIPIEDVIRVRTGDSSINVV